MREQRPNTGLSEDVATMPERLPLDYSLMDVAWVWAHRSQCSRLQVGAILVRDGRPFAQGYNGRPRGEPACQHFDDEPCVNAVHAETNVIINAAKDGYATKGATMFVTHSPCWACSGNLINSEIAGVVYDKQYRLDDGLRRLAAAGMEVRQLM